MTRNRTEKSVPAQVLSEAEAEGLLKSLQDIRADVNAFCRHGEAVRDSLDEFVEQVERHFRAN